MIIIGEKLNSSIPKTFEAMNAGNEAEIISLIKKQADAGADFLDINTAICGDCELEKLLWVIELVKAHSSCGIMVDSTNTEVVAQAVKAAAGRDLIINSTTIADRFDAVVPLALETGASVIGLPIDDDGMPHSFEEKCRKIDMLVAKLRDAGIPDERIYIDVLIETLATNGDSAKTAIQTIAYVAETYPEVKTTCGLSNVSFGLPKRALINSAFVAAALVAGLSSAIIDPASPAMQAALAAAQVVAGQDDYCMNYITYIRSTENI
ncbi:dihydropteroate synthase [Oscillospiraceae bacterium PP1C4]